MRPDLQEHSKFIQAVLMLMSLYFIALTPASAASVKSCESCSRLKRLALEAKSAKGESAVRIIAQTGDLFQDLAEEQPILTQATARDVALLVIRLLKEDKMNISLEALRPIFRNKKNRSLVENEVSRLSPEERAAYQKAAEAVFRASSLDGNG